MIITLLACVDVEKCLDTLASVIPDPSDVDGEEMEVEEGDEDALESGSETDASLMESD